MKIIDILNDYANGKIKDGFKFRYDNKDWVIEDDSIHSINQYMSHDGMGEYVYFEDCFDLSNLNDEVEIIEEPKQLEEIDLYEDLKDILNNSDESIVLNSIHKCLTVQKYKINEIIRYIKDKENK